MKRTVIPAFAFLLFIISGCRTNELDLEGSNTDNTIRASVTNIGTPKTKALMRDQNGVAINIFWEEGDHIGVFGKDKSNVDFVLSKGSLVEGGKSAMFETDGNMPKGELVAYYPYSTEITGSDGVLTLSAPQTQKYTSYIPKPDPAANIMLARGTQGGGLLFQPVFAILKIGKRFEAETKVNSIEFRDLDGKPVCGTFTASFNNGRPVTEFTGTSNILTLDCGSLGLAPAGETKIFYLFVPARSYPKGYEITFVTTEGRVTHTVGASTGKTLQSATVYTVGDVTQYEEIEGVECELYPDAIIMDQAVQDRISIQDTIRHNVYNENGDIVWDNHGRAVTAYDMNLLVPNDLNPKVGGWLVYDEPTEILPYGGVFQISSCEKIDDRSSLVSVRSIQNPFAAYKNLQIGEEGNEIPVNLNGFISEIVDERGQRIDFSYDADGQLVFGDGAINQMVMASSSVITKDVINQWPSSFTTPEFSMSLKGDNAEAEFTPKMKLDIRTAIGAFDGDVQYVVLKINPTISMTAKFTLKSNCSLNKEMYLFGLKTTGIPIGGIVVFFEIEVSAKVEIGGEITFSTTVSCSQDMGTYAVSYNKGEGGVLTRKLNGPSAASFKIDGPEVNTSGSIYMKGGASLVSSVNVYGLLSIGLATDFLAKGECALYHDETGRAYNGLKFSFGPEIEITPRVAVNCLNWKWAHNFDELSFKFNLDPWVEKWFRPATYGYSKANYLKSEKSCVWKDLPEEYFSPNWIIEKMRTDVDNIEYDATVVGELDKDFQLGLAIKEISDYSLGYSPYTPDSEVKLASKRYEVLRSLGYPYDYLTPQYIADWHEKLVFVEPIPDAKYESGTKKKDFKGTFKPSFVFSSHKVYLPELVLLQGGEIAVDLMEDIRSYPMACSVYFCWPTDLNGDDYTME